MQHHLKAVFDARGKAQQALDELRDSGFVRTDSDDAGTSTPAGQANNAPGGDRGRAAPGAMRYSARESTHYFGTRDSDELSTTGTSLREPILPPGHWPCTPLDGLAVQGMRTGPPDSNSEARAAYRFGHDMHENDRYRNRSWNEAAGDLRVLWEARDPAGPDWELSAPALRLGWDSTSPEIDDDAYRRSHWHTNYVESALDSPVAHIPGPQDTSVRLEAASTRRHPGGLSAWENFVDAVRHGWERIRIGDDMDEADYRLHHANTYPGTNYDDFAPVYRYGNNMRRRSAFGGRGWDAVESELRAEWERGHREGKPSTWDEMKAALHHGWDHANT